MENIILKGVRVHNLKNIDVSIPKNKITVICGVSGSGKSSLAFDTIYAEAERRYVESLSSYARQFLGVRDKPSVEKIENLSPAISISQKTLMKNPRSTVGTITEIHDYLRVLYARIGRVYCPKCGDLIEKQSASQIISQIQKLPLKTEFLLLAPLINDKKGEHKSVIHEVYRIGYPRIRIDGEIVRTEEALENDLDKNKKHNIEVVIDHLEIDKNLDKDRIAESVELALKIGKGVLYLQILKGNIDFKKYTLNEKGDLLFSEHFACLKCGVSMPKIEPRLFSFNNPHGACPLCTGIGSLTKIDPDLVLKSELTLNEGAVAPWVTLSYKPANPGYYMYKLSNMADKYGFSMDVAVKNLDIKYIDLILFGDDDFEGVVPNLERRLKDTNSEYVKKEIEKYMIRMQCPKCLGKRYRDEVLSILIDKKNIADVLDLSLENALLFFKDLVKKLSESEKKIAKELIKEIILRLSFLIDVSLGYLTLSRESTTLSGGEAQRIRLATQIGSGLSGVIYVLDEPSIGLHPVDQDRLLDNLKKLKDLGNTIIIVEHDKQTIQFADHIIEIGPGAGKFGGKVVFTGTYKELLKSKTLTGEYLSMSKKSLLQDKKRVDNDQFIEVKGVSKFNISNQDFKIPLGKLNVVTGVSGSGKSTFVMEVLQKAIKKYFKNSEVHNNEYKSIIGLENIDKMILIDQSAIGRTSRSNPATYIGAFDKVRYLFSETELSKIRGYKPGRFSFSVKGGRCEVCNGEGDKKIEMHFLPDVYITCPECNGQKFNKETLEVEYKDKNIADILDMSVYDAVNFFKDIPALFNKLSLLKDVGLGYIKLGQKSTTLSGGEAQRIKLAKELSKRDTGKTLYILDEPTTGLHPDDVNKLLKILNLLVEKGNTVVVIEHDLDVIKNSDYIIDMGPYGGDKGGIVLYQGEVDGIKKVGKSFTAKFL
ncbi:MAG: excinuclease ABC subunit UvrA [Candidatus Pacebacteria bacterium]|nr:excinuclease ABC subunit UvrA [Candidatus Paceibacterota bacterium]